MSKNMYTDFANFNSLSSEYIKLNLQKDSNFQTVH